MRLRSWRMASSLAISLLFGSASAQGCAPNLRTSLVLWADQTVTNPSLDDELSSRDFPATEFKAGNRHIPVGAIVTNRSVLTRHIAKAQVQDKGCGGVPAVAPVLSTGSARDSVKNPVLPWILGIPNMWLISIDRVVEPSDPAGAVSSPVTTSPPLDPEVPALSPDRLNWFPVRFEEQFLVTCYVLSMESGFSGERIAGVPGLSPNSQYFSGFIRDVRLQGSGLAIDGRIVHYDGGGKYSYQSCPVTASGACAVDGVTIAVDKKMVPFRSSLGAFADGSNSRELTGLRALDVGDGIKGAHIDRYFGTRRTDCLNWGRRSRYLILESY